jgi:DNA-binding NtrC family response regulator
MTTKGTVLLVDDDEDTRTLLCEGLRRRGFDVYEVESGQACLDFVRDRSVDVVVTDIQMPGINGVELTELLRVRHPNLLPIVLTGFATVDTAIAAVRGGAYDYLTKPLKLDILEVAVSRAMEHLATKREARRLQTIVEKTGPITSIIGESPAVRSMTTLIRQVADSEATVLITGESGTGKELVARALHELSPRAKAPFVAINCGAMPANLLESELFGHVRGAFTDAKNSRAGLFIQAGAGTIFLDEIGEMPIEMQVKLLRVLQERTVRPVGGDEEVPFEARIITATNRDLETEVEDKRFREDLFYRINVVAIPVPALRERNTDVLLVAKHILGRISSRTHKPAPVLSPEVSRKLLDYQWPGNVRELENTLERAVAMCKDGQIGLSDLPKKVVEYEHQRLEIATVPEQLITLDEMERRYVRQVLASMNGNKTHAARVLGIDRRSLYRRLAPAHEQNNSPSSTIV